MALIRVTDSAELRASHVLMLALVTLALAGACLLTSSAKPDFLPDGAVAWDPDSILLAIVEILNLQYAQPTPNGVDVKGLVHGVASGLGLLIAAIGLALWARAEKEVSTGDTVIDLHGDAAPDARESLTRRQLNPARTAQVMLLLHVVWSFVSQWWSGAPDYALGGAMLLAIQAAWAFALGFGLNRRAAVISCGVLLAILALTSLLAVAYHAERNPTLRLSHPIGNPIFLASCLLPGIVMAVAVMFAACADIRSGATGRGILKILACALAAAILLYATYLTRSRGPAIGLALALVTLLVLAVNRRWRVPLATVAALGIVLAGFYFFSQRFADSPSGRSTSMRVRFFAWPYALDLLQQQPILGVGEAGYTRLADVFAIHDVEDDPAALEYRVAHAHNEWLEVAADLGVVGVVLILSTLGLTVLAAVRALPQMPARGERVMTLALVASLVGLVVAECFGVALRYEGLPLVFFTIIGLLWTMAAPVPAGLLRVLGASRLIRAACIVVAGAACVLIVEAARRDFTAARAAHDVTVKLDIKDWPAAERLAVRAYVDRLVPHRKLTAHRLLVQTRLQLAEVLQDQFLRRMTLAQSSSTDESRLRAEAARSRAACQEQIDLGEAALADLVAIAPSTFYVGALNYGFKQLRSVFSQVDGDDAAIAQHRLAAAVSLRGELDRRPFDAELAARYVLTDFDRLDHAEALALLARPLRLQRPGSFYFDPLDRLVAQPADAATMFQTLDELADQPVADDRQNWPNRWLPELLRLGAILAGNQTDYVRAERYLATAVSAYERLAGEAPLALAACRAELADARFFAAPENPAAAITAAEAAVEAAPNSQDGRLLCEQIAARLLVYHLAADHEDFARKIVRDRVRDVTEQDLDLEISNRYAQLAYSIFDAARTGFPEKLDAWSQRALALAPESGLAWVLAGDLAVVAKDAARTFDCVQSASRFGADAEVMFGLLERACAAMPDNAELQALRADLRARLSGEPPTMDAPLPDAPAPSVDTAGMPSAGTNGL